MKLENCPLCGCEADSFSLSGYPELLAHCMNVSCPVSLCTIPVKNWNHRVYSPEIQAVLNAAKEYCRITDEFEPSNGDFCEVVINMHAAVRKLKELEASHET